MRMIRRFSSAITSAHVISLIALFVALGGSVYAASHISGKTIKKSSLPGNRIKKNTVTGKQVKEASLKSIDATQLGGKAASAYQGQIQWAIINAGDGAIVAQSGNLSAARDAGGAYHVHFPVTVANKAILVTPAASGFAGSGVGSSDAKAAPCPGPPNCTLIPGGATNQDVVVSTFVGGASADAGFFVALVP
jgi:hypothetical protein